MSFTPLQAFADVDTQHRMLEGFLLRLCAAPDADAFVLRGGMLVRHWFPSAEREAQDIDLVCLLPYDPADLRVRLAAILADRRTHDGVIFDDERLRLDPLWPDSAHPGLRLFAAGRADGWSGEMSVDVTFGLDVWPAALRSELTLQRGRAPLWVCQPEMLVGRKLRVTADLGRRHWRPKDLADMWLVLTRLAPKPGEAIERTFPDVREAASLLQQPWWSAPHAAARWWRFRRDASPVLPEDLGQVVDEVRAMLSFVVGST